MFSLILKNCGFHRTFRPFASQVRTFKREVTSEDLNKNDFFNKFDKYKNGEINGKDLYYPKYGSSIYDDKIINDNKIIINNFNVENEKWTGDRED
jgi:hypothetical protein